MTDYFTRVFEGKSTDLKKSLALLFPEFSYNEINKFLRCKDVKINGKRTTESNLNTGDTVSIYCMPNKINLSPIYDDAHYSIFFKKRGLQSDGYPSLESLVKYKYGDNYTLMHRLDTNTEGLLIFSKDEEYTIEMRKIMDEEKVEKHYFAKVYGIIQKTSILKGWLVKKENIGLVKVYHKQVTQSEYCETKIIPITTEKGTTLLEVIITKGRTHQIRAMLADNGTFILGDSKYGRDDINKKYGYSKQQLTAFKIVFHTGKDGKLAYLNGKEISI